MRAVLDANIFVSATIRPATPPAQVLAQWRRKAFDLISSPALLAELREVLQRPTTRRYARWPQEEIDVLLAELEPLAIWVEPEQRLTVVERDPDDNRVIEAAIAGHADVNVSGDRDLLELGEYGGIRILTPREFLDLLETST